MIMNIPVGWVAAPYPIRTERDFYDDPNEETISSSSDPPKILNEFAKKILFKLTMNGIQNAYTPISVLVPQTFEFELEETY